MNERRRWLVWGGFVLGVVTLVGWWSQPVPGSEGVTRDQPGKGSGTDTSVSLVSEQGAAPVRVADLASQTEPEMLLGDEDLIAALRALGSLDENTGGDVSAIERRVDELTMAVISPIGRLQRAVELLTEGRLTEDPTLTSAPERGAVRGLVLGSLLHRHGQRSKSRLRASSPEKVVCLALEGAPTWTPAVRDQLLYLANACATDKGRFVTGKHIRLVVELRALHPDLRSFYSELLGFIMVDLPEVDQHLLLDILQGEQEDPLLVRLALKQLFDQGKAQLAIGLARALLDGEDTRNRVRVAALWAVAGSAPMDLALDFVTEFGRDGDLTVSMALTHRPGGEDAVLERYSELVMAGAAGDTRRLLIAGVTNPSVLLGVAQTDPAASVRSQAIMSGTGIAEVHNPEQWLDLLEQSVGVTSGDSGAMSRNEAAYAGINILKQGTSKGSPMFKRAAQLLEDLLDEGALSEGTAGIVRKELIAMGLPR